jgi:hypothetical protein
VTDADLTIAAVRAHRWQVVRLAARSKRPIGKTWEVTRDGDQVARWIADGDNVGLVCNEDTGVAVLDPDEMQGWAEMLDELGLPSLPWVITGSGRLHYYVRWAGDLPAKLTWRGTIIGEIQRGPGQQQIVLPPSVHPTTGIRYRWVTERLGFLCEPINPSGLLPALPGLWLAYLRSHTYAA